MLLRVRAFLQALLLLSHEPLSLGLSRLQAVARVFWTHPLTPELGRAGPAVALASVAVCFSFLFLDHCALDDHSPLVKEQGVVFRTRSLWGSLLICSFVSA